MDKDKIFIIGVIFICIGIGLIMSWRFKVPFPHLGKLPGDIFIKKGNFTFYFPLATCVLLSVLGAIAGHFILRR
jgi:Protein of unknown function (DUF2905)